MCAHTILYKRNPPSRYRYNDDNGYDLCLKVYHDDRVVYAGLRGDKGPIAVRVLLLYFIPMMRRRDFIIS